MRHEQRYKIHKIQAGVSYFDNTFASHIENWWPQLQRHFFQIWFFFHKNGFKKILDIDHFVEKKILYHLRCFAPLTIEEMAKYAKNWKSRILGSELKTWKNEVPAIFLYINQNELIFGFS